MLPNPKPTRYATLRAESKPTDVATIGPASVIKSRKPPAILAKRRSINIIF
jgi:hypothetical protein